MPSETPGRVNLWSINTSWWKEFIRSDKIIEKQEDTRSKLALWFSIFYWIVITSYIAYVILWDPSQTKINLLNVVLSATTWFVWTILWFYFGEKSKNDFK